MQTLLSRYRALSPSVKTSLWFTVCNLLQRGAACLLVPIFTRILTPAEYGICSIYFALYDLLVLFTSLKLPYEGLNNGLIRYEQDKDGYTSAMLGLMLLLSLGSGALLLLCSPLLLRVTGLPAPLLWLMLPHLTLAPLLMLWTNRERFDCRYRYPVIATLFLTLANPVLAVLCVLFTPMRADARIVPLVLLQMLLGLLAAVLLLRRSGRLYNQTYWRFALSFNVPLLAYYLSQSLLNQSDRLMIGYFAGSDKAAVYSVAYTAGTLILLVVSAVNGSFNPWMYKKLKAGDYGDIRRVSFSLCLAVAAAALLAMALAPDLVAIFATAEYGEAQWIIPPVAGSVFFVFVYMMFANAEMYFDAVKKISVISIVAGVANVLLNAVCIPVFGYIAAGWTTLICYGLLTFLHFIYMRRALTANGVSPGTLFALDRILLLSVAVTLAAVGMPFVYRIPYLRYVVATVIALAAGGGWMTFARGKRCH